MTDKKQLAEIYKQNLEADIVKYIAEIKKIDLRRAFDIYYSSKLAVQIADGSYGIENLNARYLAEDLIENEQGLFWKAGKVVKIGLIETVSSFV